MNLYLRFSSALQREDGYSLAESSGQRSDVLYTRSLCLYMAPKSSIRHPTRMC